MKRLLIAAIAVMLVCLGLAAPASATSDKGVDHPPICHPVGGATGGNQHNGYSLIAPNKASSHIDESKYPDGQYWKHEHDGRHDIYANADGTCGSTPPPPPPPPCQETCPKPAQLADSKGDLVCVGTYTGGVYDNVRTKRGKSCTMVNSQINGSFFSKNAENVRLRGTVVVGGVDLIGTRNNAEITDGQGCKYDPPIGEHIVIRDAHNVLLCQLTVCDEIVVDGFDGRASLRNLSAQSVTVTGGNKLVRPYVGHRHPEWIRIYDVRVKDTVNTAGNARHVELRRVIEHSA